MGSSGVEAVDRKQKIRDRYKGVDASELEVIPAKAVEGFGESTSIRREALNLLPGQLESYTPAIESPPRPLLRNESLHQMEPDCS